MVLQAHQAMVLPLVALAVLQTFLPAFRELGVAPALRAAMVAALVLEVAVLDLIMQPLALDHREGLPLRSTTDGNNNWHTGRSIPRQSNTISCNTRRCCGANIHLSSHMDKAIGS
jgi:hypothetical protein